MEGGRGGSPLRSTCPGADPPPRREDRARPQPEALGCVVARPRLCVEKSGGPEAREEGADLPKRSLSVRGSALVSPDRCETEQSRAGQDFLGLHPRPATRAGGSRWGRSCTSRYDLDRRASDPLCSARPARLGVTSGHRLPLPAPEPGSPRMLTAAPHQHGQGPSYSASPFLPLPAAAAPHPGPQAKPRWLDSRPSSPSVRVCCPSSS